jgi:hypothetical protein
LANAQFAHIAEHHRWAVFDEDPPFVAGAEENGYDESLATIKGRFWYVQLKKRF